MSNKRKYDEVNEEKVKGKNFFKHVNKKIKSSHYRNPYYGFLCDEIKSQMKFIPSYKLRLGLSSHYKVSLSVRSVYTYNTFTF